MPELPAVGLAEFENPETAGHVLRHEAARVTAYLEGCSVGLAATNPTRELVTAAVEPIVDRLAGESAESMFCSEVLATISMALHKHYPPATEDAVHNPADHRYWREARSLVAQTVFAAHCRALETDDCALGAHMTSLACDLLGKELLPIGQPPDNLRPQDIRDNSQSVNMILVAALQSSVAREMELRSVHGQSTDRATDWLLVRDQAHVRDMLGCALLADRLNLNESATVHFLLESYGFNGEEIADLQHAWRLGFQPSKSAAPSNWASTANLKCIVEAEIAGASTHQLYTDRGVRCFARKSTEFLRYQAALPLNAANSVGLISAVHDQELGTFNNPATYDQLLCEATKGGKKLQYFECGSAAELLVCMDSFPQTSITQLAIEAHGGLANLLLGDPEKDGSSYSVADIERSADWLRYACQNIQGIALFICGSAAIGGLRNALSHELQGGIVVQGLRRSGSVRVGFGPKGFVLHPNPGGKPTPLGGELGWLYRVTERLPFLVGITEDYRLSTQQEYLLRKALNDTGRYGL